MAEVVHEDMVEQILIRLDLKDLLRYKSVCKSWYSLITSSRFFIRHKDRCINEHGDKKILLRHCDIEASYRLVGSSNGLVCIYDAFRTKLIVGNPLTREVRHLEPPPHRTIGLSSCWGFGYDSFRDDYKVFFATWKGENQACVQVFSLKSNTWREIGIVKYKFTNWMAGMLCNGVLHWILRSDDKNNIIIVSYNFTNDEFKEIPVHVDARVKLLRKSIRNYIGIYKGCLCICPDFDGYKFSDIWVMNKYGVKESWELLRTDIVMKNDTLSFLRKTPQEHERSSSQPDKSLFWKVSEYRDSHKYTYRISAPIFVQSLVSPHLNVNL